jgi:PLP dependent protein
VAINTSNYQNILLQLQPTNTTLVAVSKIKPVSDIQQLYNLGQRDFGENYVQELVEKQPQLPADTRWHFIGHLQSNKVKYIAPFVHLIHGVDSLKLLQEINKQAKKNNRNIACLLQVYIAREESKFGFDATELMAAIDAIQSTPQAYSNVTVQGLMGMASFSDDQQLVRREFTQLKELFDVIQARGFPLQTLSMGMSGDYQLAIACGSNMVRIGSLLFGARV